MGNKDTLIMANKIQIKMIGDMENGLIEIPKTKEGQADLMRKLLLAYDYEAFESNLIEKCRDQFIKLSISSDNIGNWVYLSVVRNVLRKRNYYKQLSKSMRNRGINDAATAVAARMVIDGLLIQDGSGFQVAATLKAESLIEEKDNKTRDLRLQSDLLQKI